MKFPVMRWVGLTLMAVGLVVIASAWLRGPVAPQVATPNAQARITSEPTAIPPSDTLTVLPPTPTHTPAATPTGTLSPTLTASATATRVPASPTHTRLPPTRTPVPSSISAAKTGVKVPVWQGRARFGVGVPSGLIARYPVERLGVGWYLNWNINASPPRSAGVEYAQMIRIKHGVLMPGVESIAHVARSVPGSLWLVGNEPDRAVWQDDSTPVQYATAYHQAYGAIKQADPTALVAIAGVVQPTPLRLRYLDAALVAYQELYGAPMPVDVWNVHNFVVREERGSWGAEIPPGLPDTRGILRQVEDNDNLEIFKAQIWAFRRWMRDRGQRDKPLIVSEYGILMPPDYGFDPPRVIRFMRGTFDFFLSASDPELGYPPDGNRLVQRWCWYSLADTEFPAGNLFDPQTLEWTAVGKAWQEYVIGQ